MTKKAKNTALLALQTFEDEIDNLQQEGEMDVGEEAISIILGLSEVIKHEIERIVIRD